MRRWILLLTGVMVLAAPAAWSQVPPGIAIVSPPLEKTTAAAGKSPLAEVLIKSGETFTDVTAVVRAGRLSFAPARVLMIDSGALSNDNGRIAGVLADGKGLLAAFVEAGGILIVFTHPDDPSRLTFLPGAMQAHMTAESHDRRVAVMPEHPLVAGRHRLAPRDLGSRRGVLYPGECYGLYRGLVPVVAYDRRGRYPIVLEGSAGTGRVVLIHLSPARAFLTGTEDEKVSATLLVENVVEYARQALAGKLPKTEPGKRVLEGTVFEDANADGRRDPDEKLLAGVPVSDGEHASGKTGPDGRYSLALDAYSEFVWVTADFAKYKGPLWQRIPVGDARLDFPLVARETPLSANPRIVYLVDVGGKAAADEADPELARMLDEVARLEPKPDVLFIPGDGRACERRAEVIRKYAPPFEVIHGFVPGAQDTDVVAERDAFRKILGPTPGMLRLHSSGFGVHDKTVLEWLSPADATPSFRRGGLASPIGFFVLDPPHSRRHEFRLAGFKRLLNPIYPALEATVPAGPLNVSFAVADTALGPDIPVKVEMAHIRRNGERLELVELALPEYRLLPRGRFTRSVVFEEPVSLTEGFYVMRFTAGPPAASWSRNVSFVVQTEELPAREPGRPWLAPGGNVFHTGASADGVEPPFYLADVVNVGGRVLRGSPIVLAEEVLVRRAARLSQMSELIPDRAERQPSVRGTGFPFCWHAQGLFEMRGDRVLLTTAEEPPRTFRFDFTGRPPDDQTTHMAVGGEFLCVVDARGTAWGFARTRGAQVKDGRYDAKAAAESIRWQVPISSGCWQAVVTDAELFTGSECLEVTSGKVRWKLAEPVLTGTSVALSGEHLVVTGVRAGDGPAQQVVLVVERETGKVVWEKVLATVRVAEGPVTPPPAVARGVVFVGSADGVFRALRLSNGDELWRFATGASVMPLSAGPEGTSGRILAGAVVSEDAVIFGAADGTLYALDRRKGTLEWTCSVGLPITGSPALSGNMLYVTDWDGNLYTFVSTAGRRR